MIDFDNITYSLGKNEKKTLFLYISKILLRERIIIIFRFKSLRREYLLI